MDLVVAELGRKEVHRDLAAAEDRPALAEALHTA